MCPAARSARSRATSSTASRAATPRSMSRAARCTRAAGAICNRPTWRISTATSAGAATAPSCISTSLAAHSMLNGPGTSPVELLAADPAAQFTAPNQINNHYASVSLTGNVDISDTISLQAVTYYNNFLQRVTNGNAPNDTPCNDGSGSAVLRRRLQHHARRRRYPGLPERRFLFGTGQPDHEHQWLRRLDPGDRYADTCSASRTTSSRGVSFDGAQTMFSGDLLHRRHYRRLTACSSARAWSSTSQAPTRRCGWRSATRIMACSSPTRSTSPTAWR